MCRQSMQAAWIEPSMVLSARRRNIASRKAANSAAFISPQPMAKLACRIRPSPQTWPSIGTL
jgi:hypothetical protein